MATISHNDQQEESVPVASVQPDGEQHFDEMSKRSQLYDLFKKSLKLGSLLLTVWLIGLLGCSFAWVILGLLVVLVRDHLNYDKQLRLKFERLVVIDEKQLIESIKHLPSWIHFLDKEQAEWINKQLWPYLDEVVKNLIRTSFEQNIVMQVTDYLKSFRFEKVNLF